MTLLDFSFLILTFLMKCFSGKGYIFLNLLFLSNFLLCYQFYFILNSLYNTITNLSLLSI